MGRWPPFLSHAASLPLVVVLPEPCRPAIRMTVGGCEANLKRAVSLPSSAISSSRTILITCSDGDSAVSTSVPIAFARMCSIRSLDHIEVDVGLEQRHADLAQSLGDILLGQRALAAKILECALQFVGKILKHRSLSSVSCVYDSEEFPIMKIRFERHCEDCGSVTEGVTADWQVLGAISPSGGPTTRPSPACARCLAWRAKKTIIDPCKPYFFRDLPGPLQERLRAREKKSKSLDQEVVSRVVGQKEISNWMMKRTIAKALIHVSVIGIGLLLFRLLWDLLAVIVWFPLVLFLSIFLVAFVDQLRDFILQIRGVPTSKPPSILLPEPVEAGPLPSKSETVPSPLETRDAVYLTPHYLIVVRDGRITYIPNSSVEQISFKPIREYDEHGVEVEFCEGHIKYTNGESVFLAEEQSAATLKRLPEVVQRSKERGKYWEQDDLRMSG